MRDKISDLLSKVQSPDQTRDQTQGQGQGQGQSRDQGQRALARLLTALESEGAAALARHPELLSPVRPAFRVGITGPPGAGKSTLISRLIASLRAQGKRVGVMAVDPSSPFSRGAVLGDRIRYLEHFGDPGVFIRSLGSRGSLGGLSAAAYLMVRAFDQAGFDVLLLETVGVGQTELEIMNVADWVAVVLVPESGDSIQGMKAGLLEIADLFVVNKSDRPDSDRFRHELEAALRLDTRNRARPIDVLLASALAGAGVGEVVTRFSTALDNGSWRGRRDSPERLRAEARALLRFETERAIEARAAQVQNKSDFAALFASI
jgi:LAO/AO transport system kinase